MTRLHTNLNSDYTLELEDSTISLFIFPRLLNGPLHWKSSMYLSISMLSPSPACSVSQEDDLWGWPHRFYSPLVFSQAQPMGSPAGDGRREQHEVRVPIYSAPSHSAIADSFHHGSLLCQRGHFTSLHPHVALALSVLGVVTVQLHHPQASKPPLWFPYTLSSSCK